MRVNMFRNFNEMADENDSFLKKIVTGDATWHFLNNPRTKRKSSECKEKISPRKENYAWTKADGKCCAPFCGENWASNYIEAKVIYLQDAAVKSDTNSWRIHSVCNSKNIKPQTHWEKCFLDYYLIGLQKYCVANTKAMEHQLTSFGIL
ncbi:hypothetical protein TNCV_583431 [Trichonephila clavipes]|nr:hypothetical protein TNCV_583431 [Trichonephila clavipes]